MRSESKIPFAADTFVVPLSYASAMELEQRARAYRARVIGELLADALFWLTRLPRRLAESMEVGAPKQRV
jgi:hypothetical protein